MPVGASTSGGSSGSVDTKRRLVLQPPSAQPWVQDRSGFACSIHGIGSAGTDSNSPIAGTRSLAVYNASSCFHGIAGGTVADPVEFFRVPNGVSAFIEFFVYFAALPNAHTHIFGPSHTSAQHWEIGLTPSNQLQFYSGSAYAGATSLSALTWHHGILDIRNAAGNTVLYLDSSVDSTKNSDTHDYKITPGTNMNIGAVWSAWGSANFRFQGRYHIGENHPDPTGPTPTSTWNAVDNIVM